MSHTELSPRSVGRFAVACVVGSLLCAALLVAFPRSGLRAPVGSLGFTAAWIGTAVAFWCSLRLRDRLCYLASALSVPNMLAWAWLTYVVIHESAWQR